MRLKNPFKNNKNPHHATRSFSPVLHTIGIAQVHSWSAHLGHLRLSDSGHEVSPLRRELGAHAALHVGHRRGAHDSPRGRRPSTHGVDVQRVISIPMTLCVALVRLLNRGRRGRGVGGRRGDGLVVIRSDAGREEDVSVRRQAIPAARRNALRRARS